MAKKLTIGMLQVRAYIDRLVNRRYVTMVRDVVVAMSSNGMSWRQWCSCVVVLGLFECSAMFMVVAISGMRAMAVVTVVLAV